MNCFKIGNQLVQLPRFVGGIFDQQFEKSSWESTSRLKSLSPFADSKLARFF
jgi:hypothetical protein